jgi:hypothetical protein
MKCVTASSPENSLVKKSALNIADALLNNIHNHGIYRATNDEVSNYQRQFFGDVFELIWKMKADGKCWNVGYVVAKLKFVSVFLFKWLYMNMCYS